MDDMQRLRADFEERMSALLRVSKDAHRTRALLSATKVKALMLTTELASAPSPLALQLIEEAETAAAAAALVLADA